MRKVEFSRFQNGMTLGTFNAWGIQTGPFVALAVPFVPKYFSTFSLGGQFLLPQRPRMGKIEFPQLQNGMTVGIFNAWGNFTHPFSRNLGSSF